MRENGISFYNAHAPLDMHPEVSPSRMCSVGVGLENLVEYFPICEGIPGGAAIIGDSLLTVEGLAEALRSYLGPEIKVHVLTRPRGEAGRVAMVAGGGAVVEILEASLERGCQTYVTGNAATTCRLDFVQEQVRAFRELADAEGVTLLDAMHYGMEKPPQLAMAEWFRGTGSPPSSSPTARSSCTATASCSLRSRARTCSSAATQRWSSTSPAAARGARSPARCDEALVVDPWGR